MKTILITGATSGIGEALAKLCAQNGYRVLACGRNQQALNKLAELSNIETLKFDVTSIEETNSALGNVDVDIAVLNAGVCEYVDVENFEPEMFQRVFSANFFGVVNSISALLPNLKMGNQLVVVDSLARLLPFTRSQAYGASKAAVHYLTKSLEVDLAKKGVIVQSVSPGFVETPLTDKNDFEMPTKISVQEAVEGMLKGIEANKSSIYFPIVFSLLLRFLSILPSKLKVAISKRIKNEENK